MAVEFFFGALFASFKENGGRPGVFDIAFLMTRYRREFTMLEMPALVRVLVMPVVYAVGVLLGKYGKYDGAPEPMTDR